MPEERSRSCLAGEGLKAGHVPALPVLEAEARCALDVQHLALESLETA